MVTLKKILILSILGTTYLLADIQKRIEYKLGRVQAQTFSLAEEVDDINNIMEGNPFVPFSNNDGNLYPCNLASDPVKLQLISTLSRLPRTQSALRIPEAEDFSGIWWRNVASTSWLTVNPTNQANRIIAFSRDRSNLQDPLSIDVYYSLDGSTWGQASTIFNRVQGPTNPRCVRDFQIVTDPFLAFDNDGSACNLIFIGNNVRPEMPSDTSPHQEQAVIVSQSQDGGATWNQPQYVTADDGRRHWYVTPTIWANPFVNGLIYAVWADLRYFVGNGNTCVIQISRSFDGGNSWEVPVDVYTIDSSVNQEAFFLPEVRISRFGSGNLFLFVKTPQINGVYSSLAPGGGFVLESTDNGETWAEVFIIDNLPSNVAIDPDDPTTYIRTMPTQFATDIHPTQDWLYVVSQSSFFAPPGLGGTFIALSKDGGVTFPVFMPINPDTPEAQAFNPSVAVNADGKVGVLFYDFRNHTPGSPALETDVWLAIYNEDLTVREQEIRLTPVSFDMRQAMRASLDLIGIDNGATNYYLGDYCSLQANISDFIASFVVTNPPYGVGASPIPGPNYEVDLRRRQDIIFAYITMP